MRSDTPRMPNETETVLIEVSKKVGEGCAILELTRYFPIMLYVLGTLVLSLLNDLLVKNSQVKYSRFQNARNVLTR